MEHTFGNDKSLSWRQINGSALQINQEPAFNNVEKFVVIVVLVPIVFALDHADTDNRGVYLAKRLMNQGLVASVSAFSLITSSAPCKTLSRVS
jgi:hypothetical protein